MAIPCVVAWFSWLARNKVKFEEQLLLPSKVASNCLAFLKKNIQWKAYPDLLKTGYKSNQPNSVHTLVYWMKPVIGWMKANTDGSFYKSNVGIGGLFRNLKGSYLLNFLPPTAIEDVLETEAIAIYWAILVSSKAHIQYLLVEADSQ
ncbi:uncharacterized protein LOC110038519, partial [Phalaenopsis equestris]|uniref:uncharacterized protein LOC110038519 n=1 Tax=Phalaenopsis equestris TaxID=78828 RepID=UPI0009E2FAE3